MAMYTIEVTYDPTTRRMSLANGTDLYGGATIDSNSVSVSVTGIVPTGIDFSARIDVAVPITTDGYDVIRPFVPLEQNGDRWEAVIPQPILMAAKETRKLPFQLVTRHGDTVINSRNTIVLTVTRAIDAMGPTEEMYSPYIMLRNDSWEWVSDFHYKAGSVVTKDGEIYIALQDSMDKAPDGPDGPEYWRKKAEGLPDGQYDWQILGRDDDSAEWRTLSERHEVTTVAGVELDIAHQFGNRPVACRFYENGLETDVPYECGNGKVTIQTTSAHTYTAVITALPYEVIST